VQWLTFVIIGSQGKAVVWLAQAGIDNGRRHVAERAVIERIHRPAVDEDRRGADGRAGRAVVKVQ